jgi:translation elongation factor EF-1beta
MNSKKAVILIHLVPESENANNERIEREIKESLKCDWLAEIEKVTVNET